jgi:hypothetical protein
MASIRIRTKVAGETLVLPELRPLVGKTVDIEVTERPDEAPPAAAAGRPGLAALTARGTTRELEADAAGVGMAVEEYLAFRADLDADPLRVPGLSPAGAVAATFVPAGRVRPLPLPDLDD